MSARTCSICLAAWPCRGVWCQHLRDWVFREPATTTSINDEQASERNAS